MDGVSRGGSAEGQGGILLIEQIGQESMKYHITGRGRGQKQPPGPDRVGLTGGGRG